MQRLTGKSHFETKDAVGNVRKPTSLICNIFGFVVVLLRLSEAARFQMISGFRGDTMVIQWWSCVRPSSFIRDWQPYVFISGCFHASGRCCDVLWDLNRIECWIMLNQPAELRQMKFQGAKVIACCCSWNLLKWNVRHFILPVSPDQCVIEKNCWQIFSATSHH